MTDVLLPHNDASALIISVFEHLDTWAMRSPETFRNALLGDGMFALNPMLVDMNENGTMLLRKMLRDVVAEGRMINFGFIPNEMIKTDSVRARTMFEAGEFVHPYENWIGVTSWEGGFNAYLVMPHPHFPGDTLVVEIYGVSIPNAVDVVLIYDMVSIGIKGQGNTLVSPVRMKYSNGRVETDHEIRLRGSNSLDPLVVMLRLLADASIPVEHRIAPERLNKARAKQGKFPIPDYTHVDTRDYVATFSHTATGERADHGGHHASPVAHWRRAHKRMLASGRVVPVRSSKVNWRDAEELHRLFYRVDT